MSEHPEPDDDARPAAIRPVVWLVALVAFVVLALVLALTRPPQSDEGHFANAGAALASRGRFVMPMWTAWIPTLDQRVYSNMPLYFLTLAAWFKLFGVSWLTLRVLSVVFGVVLLLSLTSVLRSVSRDRATVTLGLVFLALNYDVINLSSARYDVMTAALSAAGLAVYLHLRERSLGRALFLGNLLQAAACLTHPYALFGMVGLAIFILMLDRRRLTLRYAAIAAAPYALALAAWGAYIARDPAMFRQQFAENARGRLSGGRGPFAFISAELRERYLERFAGWHDGVPAAMRLKTLLLVAYGFALVVCLASRRIKARTPARALVLYTAVSVVLLALLDAHRWYIYLIYVVPWLALCLALVAGQWYDAGGWRRRSVQLGSVAFALFTVASVTYRARLDVHHRAFLPAARYLASSLHDGDLVIAGGEFGVSLGFEQHVRDDSWLGYKSGLRPAFIVLSTEGRDLVQSHLTTDAAFRRYFGALMTGYRPVFESSAGSARYEVFGRNEPPSARVSGGAAGSGSGG